MISGNVEPTDLECDWPSDEEDEEEIVSSNYYVTMLVTLCL